ncbi:hypothetical protein GCM10010191_08300 [Actinomadura vinacea]|uniref:MFS transporter n=2 Tax=Actinomadura vinacea TaxID=115336 RepID=A0ABP5VH76_9ACTN
MTITGTIVFEWSVMLPLLAKEAFDGDAETFTAMGLGAVLGGLSTASRVRTSGTAMVIAAAMLSTLMMFAAAVPALWSALALIFVIGGLTVVPRSARRSSAGRRKSPVRG